MTSSAQKKSAKETAPTAPVSQPAAVAQTPALIAYHAIPVPKGQQAILSPIGAAFAHPDGEGFTLNLHLMPTTGGQIILRVPKAKKTA